MRCRECGAELNENSKFCLNCGTEVLSNKSQKTCPHCGADNDSDSEFCKNCGYAFNSENYYPTDGYETTQRGLSTGAIITICLLALALFVAIMFMIFQFANNNQQKKQTQTTAKTVENTDNQTQKSTTQNKTAPVYTYDTAPDTSQTQSIEPDYSDSDSDSSSTTTTTTTATSSDYIIPDSNSRYLSRSDLVNLSEDELCLARNEISARHGRRYNTDWIQEYFNTKSWYTPMYGPEEFDSTVESSMSELERANMETIKSYEQEMGYL